MAVAEDDFSTSLESAIEDEDMCVDIDLDEVDINLGDFDDECEEQDEFFHIENGHSTTVVSTSQLEGENGRVNALIRRRVKLQVFMRILMIHTIKVNIRQGVKFGRIPSEVEHCDVHDLFHTTMVCKDVIPLSKSEAWASGIIQKVKKTKSVQQAGILSVSEQSESHQQQNLRDLWQPLQLTHLSSVRLSTQGYAKVMSVSSSDSFFSSDETLLLGSLRYYQLKFVGTYAWAKCPAVTTILYNSAVSLHPDCAPKSYSHIVKQLRTWMTAKVVFVASKTVQNPFQKSRETKVVHDAVFNQEDKALASSLYAALSSLVFDWIFEDSAPGKKIVFTRIWMFLSFIHPELPNYSEKKVANLWDNERRRLKRIKDASTGSTTAEKVQSIEAIGEATFQRVKDTSITAENDQSIEAIGDDASTGSASAEYDQSSTEFPQHCTVVCQSNEKQTKASVHDGKKRKSLPSFSEEHYDFISQTLQELGENACDLWAQVLVRMHQKYGEKFASMTKNTLWKRYTRHQSPPLPRMSAKLSPSPPKRPHEVPAAPPNLPTCAKCEKNHKKCRENRGCLYVTSQNNNLASWLGAPKRQKQSSK